MCRNLGHVIGHVTDVCVRNLNRSFLYNTLKVIQLGVLYHIFTNYEFEFARRSL